MGRVRGSSILVIGVLMALVSAGCGGDDDDSSSASEAVAEKAGQDGSAASKASKASKGGPTIKIGGLWATTGIIQSFGKNSSAVMKLAIDEINDSGGVELADGRRVPLEGVLYDEGCPTPETGIAAARKAVDDPIVIIIGPTCSSTAEPVFGLLQKTLDNASDTGLQMPFFTDTAVKAGLAKISPWAFRNVPSELEMYAGLFSHLKETTDYETVAIGTEIDFAHSKSTSDNAIKMGAEQAGFRLVADVGWKLSDTDFSVQGQKIAVAKPDVVVAASHPFTTCGFLKELGRQGFEPKAVVALTSSLTQETIDGCPKQAEGMIGPTSFAPVNDKAAALAERVAAEYGGFVDLHSAPVYENLMLLKDLFKPAGVEGRSDTVAADRRRLRDQLEKVTTFDGLLGKITFRHDLGGEVDKPWLVTEIKDGEFTVRWIPPQYADVVEKKAS